MINVKGILRKRNLNKNYKNKYNNNNKKALQMFECFSSCTSHNPGYFLEWAKSERENYLKKKPEEV